MANRYKIPNLRLIAMISAYAWSYCRYSHPRYTYQTRRKRDVTRVFWMIEVKKQHIDRCLLNNMVLTIEGIYAENHYFEDGAFLVIMFSDIILLLFIWAFHVVTKNINATNEALEG